MFCGAIIAAACQDYPLELHLQNFQLEGILRTIIANPYAMKNAAVQFDVYRAFFKVCPTFEDWQMTMNSDDTMGNFDDHDHVIKHDNLPEVKGVTAVEDGKYKSGCVGL